VVSLVCCDMTLVTDAATVILLRDGDASPEVFLLRRHAASVFMAGAYVFPGGRVDPSDYSLPAELIDDPSTPDLGLRAAAARETFEESGVLLGRNSDGSPISTEVLLTRKAKQLRHDLQDREVAIDWADWLFQEGFVLSLSELVFTSWWVTPPGNPRRFDTRFYLAALPEGQHAWHDGVEMTDSFWMAPQSAAASAARGELMIVPPTLQNLRALKGNTVKEALAHRRQFGDPIAITPTMRGDDEGRAWVTSPDLEPDIPMPKSPSES
jgi:8-oxo-dGTP pyrophosphatase MutT (NUDIX family)